MSKNFMIMRLLADRKWHSKAAIKDKVIRAIPPEYFARLRVAHHHNGIPSISSWWFAKALWCLKRDGVIERKLPNGRVRPAMGENYQIRLTDSGYARYRRYAKRPAEPVLPYLPA